MWQRGLKSIEQHSWSNKKSHHNYQVNPWHTSIGRFLFYINGDDKNLVVNLLIEVISWSRIRLDNEIFKESFHHIQMMPFSLDPDMTFVKLLTSRPVLTPAPAATVVPPLVLMLWELLVVMVMRRMLMMMVAPRRWVVLMPATRLMMMMMMVSMVMPPMSMTFLRNSSWMGNRVVVVVGGSVGLRRGMCKEDEAVTTRAFVAATSAWGVMDAALTEHSGAVLTTDVNSTGRQRWAVEHWAFCLHVWSVDKKERWKVALIRNTTHHDQSSFDKHEKCQREFEKILRK